MKNKQLKNLSFGLFALITLIMVIATIVEKIKGSSFVQDYIYCAIPMIVLWGVAFFLALCYIIQQKLYKQVVTFGIHLSFLLIILGAFITYICGVQGRVHLREGTESITEYALSDGQVGSFPFSLQLKDFELKYYKGTFAPMDYVSHIIVIDDDNVTSGVVSMNNIFKYRGYRFYQSGYDKDCEGASLSVSYVPYGIAVTYLGYACLFISMVAFFFQKRTIFRLLLQHCAVKKGVMIVVPLISAFTVSGAPKVLPQNVAESFCNLHIYYNDRICPLQTLAFDFTAKLCGKTSYKGLSAEQVLTGWFFYYDDWKNEPVIKIKGNEERRILGIDGQYASLTDFIDINGYKLDAALSSDNALLRRNAERANEKMNLISMLCTGSLLKIYPYVGGSGEDVIWYSLSDKLPGTVPYEQWLFIGNSMNLVAEQIAKKDWKGAEQLLDKIRKYQLREASGYMPSEQMFKAEKFYNKTNFNRFLAMSCVSIGIVFFIIGALFNHRESRYNKIVRKILRIGLLCICVYLTVRIVLRGFISGHLPVSNGFETMQFMAWCSVVMTLLSGKRFRLSLPFGYLLCGLTLLVAMMGEATPQITQLMPVLQSPLLSIHVVVIMLAYTLFAFMMLNGLAVLIIHYSRRKDSVSEIESLTVMNRIMLYPAVFLLATGIFVGAVWANVSWGRYWGWDPKEVWALITMLVYSTAFHSKSFHWLNRPLRFNIFCVVAFITVIITYFGVNFILGGMHAYA